jgi:uncharacterized membrane protein
LADILDADTADRTFAALKSADEATDDFTIERSVVVAKDSNGMIDVKETSGGLGVFAGLFAPLFLLAAAIGAGIGAIAGKLAKRHEEKKFGTELDHYMDADSSEILVVMDNQYLDGVEAAL